MKNIKIAILGVGYLGQLHLKNLLLIDKVEVVGFYEPNDANANYVIENFRIKRYQDVETLIQLCDAVDVIAPTIKHFELCMLAIKYCKHFFVEKPVTHTIVEAETLKVKAREKHLITQVGHVERFNPVFQEIKPLINQPILIECQRLAPFNIRGTDVNVVLDLMIHDIDLVLDLVNSKVTTISVFGSEYITNQEDIMHVQLKFASGCCCILTASRIGNTKLRQMKVLDKNGFFTIDLLNRRVEFNKVGTDIKIIDDIIVNKLNLAREDRLRQDFLDSYNPLLAELISFVDSVINRTESAVDLSAGLNALKIAIAITHHSQANRTLLIN